jgi:hypothetical protein
MGLGKSCRMIAKVAEKKNDKNELKLRFLAGLA